MYVDFTHKYKINQGVMVGQSESLGWSPSNYNLFLQYVNLALNILIEQEFGSQISLPKLNTFDLNLVSSLHAILLPPLACTLVRVLE